MIDYIAIATGCHLDMLKAHGSLALVPVSPAFVTGYRMAAAMDLQNAIDNAFRVGQLGAVGEQVEMFRMAA